MTHAERKEWTMPLTKRTAIIHGLLLGFCIGGAFLMFLFL